MRTLFAIIGSCAALCTAVPLALADAPMSPADWVPRAGDEAIVDVSQSIVYLVHDDGQYLPLDALTGQWRVVSYDGITYNARTPTREWELRGFEHKGRSVTFGEGRFGRLAWPGHDDPRRGDDTTAYGFHSHLSFAKMLNDKHEKTAWDPTGTGHRSMGCILLSEDDLSIVEKTVDANGGVLRVSTRDTVDVAEFSRNALAGDFPPSWLGWGRQP